MPRPQVFRSAAFGLLLALPMLVHAQAVETSVEILPTIPVQTPEDAPEAALARRHLIQAGVFHINNLDRSRELHTRLKPGVLLAAGVEPEFTSPGTAVRVSSEQTLALIYSYFLSDHLVLKFEGGVPARFSIRGRGIVQPTGPLGETVAVNLASADSNPLAKVTQWSPVIIAQYVFRAPDKALRPYVGAGLTYTWFTKVRADADFIDELNAKFGSTLSIANLKTGATRVRAAAADDLAPLFNLGLSYELDRRWSIASSISYSLLKTTASISIDAADGERLSTSRTQLELNPLVMSLLVGYRFSL